MTTVTSNIVFDDIFTINAIDKEGKKFDRVSRLYAHSKNYDMDLTLDYNVELFPLKQDQSFALALASSLSRGPAGANGDADEADDKDREVWRPDRKGHGGLEEDYDYIMYGKVYKFDGGTAEIAYDKHCPWGSRVSVDAQMREKRKKQASNLDMSSNATITVLWAFAVIYLSILILKALRRSGREMTVLDVVQ